MMKKSKTVPIMTASILAIFLAAPAILTAEDKDFADANDIKPLFDANKIRVETQGIFIDIFESMDPAGDLGVPNIEQDDSMIQDPLNVSKPGDIIEQANPIKPADLVQDTLKNAGVSSNQGQRNLRGIYNAANGKEIVERTMGQLGIGTMTQDILDAANIENLRKGVDIDQIQKAVDVNDLIQTADPATILQATDAQRLMQGADPQKILAATDVNKIRQGANPKTILSAANAQELTDEALDSISLNGDEDYFVIDPERIVQGTNDELAEENAGLNRSPSYNPGGTHLSPAELVGISLGAGAGANSGNIVQNSLGAAGFNPQAIINASGAGANVGSPAGVPNINPASLVNVGNIVPGR